MKLERRVKKSASLCPVTEACNHQTNTCCCSTSASLSLCLCGSDSHVILEIPARPVRAGSDVTLRCNKKSGGTVAAYFYFNGRPVGPKPEHSITINVQQSDEGLYWCATDEFGSSPQSSLRVRGQNTDITSCLTLT